MEITSTEAQNNFGQYLKFSAFEDIIITKNGKKVAVIKRYEEKTPSGCSVEQEAGAYKTEKTRITYEEFLKLTDGSDNRYEYINGEVYLLASPTFEHQRVVSEILGIFHNWFKGKKCRPIAAPFDVTLFKYSNEDDINVVQPDILVICDTEKVNANGKYSGIPSLVVEVLSKTNKRKDMVLKLDLYINSGIDEYWIVNPYNKEVLVYSFKDYEISEYRVYKSNNIVESMIFDGLCVPLYEIFEGQ